MIFQPSSNYCPCPLYADFKMSGVLIVLHCGGGWQPSSIASISVLKHSSASSPSHAYCVTCNPSVPYAVFAGKALLMRRI